MEDSLIYQSENRATERPKTAKKRLLAAIASTFLPGLGQLILGARRTAVVFGSCLAILAIAFLALRVSQWIFLLSPAVILTIALCIYAAWHALRAKFGSLSQASGWWLLLIIPLAFASGMLYCNAFVIASGFRPYTIPSTSMEPTIMRGDRIIGDLRAYRKTGPQPGDLIIFRREKLFLLKRVAAIPGSTIEGKGGDIFVDGRPLQMNSLHHSPGMNAAVELTDFGPISIADGNLFVIGDNLDVSYDSRSYGQIPISTVVGKALYVYRSQIEPGWRDLK